ncbi:Uncharacterised protein [Mycobacterium tuberculosis]|nr:Uncharacterised protein [Mycobacterium tuberculosis]
MEQEITNHFIAVNRVPYFRMELDGEHFFVRMAHRCDRRMIGTRIHHEPFRRLYNQIAVAHPDRLLLFKTAHQTAGIGKINLRLAVFPFRSALHFALQLMSHHLHAVANAEDRHAELVNGRIYQRRLFPVHAGRTAREDDAFRLKLADFVNRGVIWQQLAVHAQIADPARDQLVILSSEVEHHNHFIRFFHG